MSTRSNNDKAPHPRYGARAARVALYLSPIILFGAAFFVYVNPSGVRVLTYDLIRPSPMISALFPADRLEGIADGRQRLRREPVYFRVRYPHAYWNATVTAQVQNPAKLPWRLGIESVAGPRPTDPTAVAAGGEWSYVLAEPDSTGSATFSLDRARIVNRTVRFLIAVPGLTASDAFSIESIRVRFERPPLWQTVTAWMTRYP